MRPHGRAARGVGVRAWLRRRPWRRRHRSEVSGSRTLARGGLLRRRRGTRRRPARWRAAVVGGTGALRWVATHPRPIAVVGVTVALGAVACRFGPGVVERLMMHPYFAVEEIVVAPTRHLHPGVLLEWAGVRPGMSIWHLRPASLAARLEAHPWVRRARVRRELPRRLVVEVEEREPVAVVVLDDFYYLDRTAAVFAPLATGERLDLPLVTGVAESGMPPRHALRHALKALRVVEAAPLPFRVSEVHIEREQGIQVFPVEPAVTLTFGWGRLGAKIERLAAVLEAFAGREAEIREIDLTFRMQAVIRLRRT